LVSNIKRIGPFTEEETCYFFGAGTAITADLGNEGFFLDVNDIDKVLLFYTLVCEKIALGLTHTDDIIRVSGIGRQINLTAQALTREVGQQFPVTCPNFYASLFQSQKLFFLVQENERFGCFKSLNFGLSV